MLILLMIAGLGGYIYVTGKQNTPGAQKINGAIKQTVSPLARHAFQVGDETSQFQSNRYSGVASSQGTGTQPDYLRREIANIDERLKTTWDPNTRYMLENGRRALENQLLKSAGKELLPHRVDFPHADAGNGKFSSFVAKEMVGNPVLKNDANSLSGTISPLQPKRGVDLDYSTIDTPIDSGATQVYIKKDFSHLKVVPMGVKAKPKINSDETRSHIPGFTNQEGNAFEVLRTRTGARKVIE